ncbi:hypothetical protein [Candidatus Nitrososphaera evergladensis]|uniref:hypothetical protein n=1 Tax=Candidatus Nitrososphaera evergladensis TaxID=1459637 RepID=UPI0011E59D67|nr:hypothetical protein [Candidatus Nitrososphaera evergladensis]
MGTASAYFGLSDWKTRVVDHRAILACYVLAVCVNSAIILTAAFTTIDKSTSSHESTISEWLAIIKESAIATILRAHGSIFAVLFLACTLFVFYRLNLLALGDALAIPAMLVMLLLAARPIEIIVYFVSALVFVLAISVGRNLGNNVRCREALNGPLRRRLYLLLFCYYGDGAACRYSFRYTGGTRRNYDRESYYVGTEKTWLVPGIPMLSGFMPAILVLLLI